MSNILANVEPKEFRPKPEAPFEYFGVRTEPDDLEALRDLVRLVRADHPEPRPLLRIVEVGSWVGQTALVLADACPEVSTLVFCVDHWEGSPHPEGGALIPGTQEPLDQTAIIARRVGPEQILNAFCRNVGPKLFRQIIPVSGKSLFWAQRWPFPVDLVFIDADHSYEACKADIQAWTPRLRPQGIIACHDYGVCPGVVKAADELGPPEAEVKGFSVAWWRV